MDGVPVEPSPDALSPEEQKAHEQLLVRNAIDNMFRLYFTPELERRVAQEQLKESFQLCIAQVILREDGKPVVRFNDEARLEALAYAPRALAAGDQVFLHEFGLLQSIELPRDELDCGHATVIYSPLGAQLFFNFRYGRERAASFTDEAEEFLETAIDALARGRKKAAIENLHTAAEKVSLAHLIVNTRKEAHGKTHNVIRTGINVWNKTGNINPHFVRFFNWICEHREKVRYSPAASIPDIPVNVFDLTRSEIAYLRQHWRWRDGASNLMVRKSPDIVMLKFEDGTPAYVMKST